MSFQGPAWRRWSWKPNASLHWAMLAAAALAFVNACAGSNASDPDRLSAFVSQRYAYLDAKRTDWQAATRYYRGIYQRSKTDRARFAALEAMLDELYDAHTHLGRNYRDSWRLPAYDVWAELRDGRFVVSAVRDGSPAAQAGVRAGAEIVTVDGMPTKAAIASRRPRFLRSSDPAADEWALLSVLSGRHDRTRTFVLRTNAGTSTVRIPISTDDASRALVSSRVVDGIGYISIGSFAVNDVVARFDRALEAFKGFKALIIDVRNNSGGDTAITRPIMGRFLTERKQYAWMARREGPKLGPRWPEFVDPRGPWTYDGKVVILVDRWSESVAEGFAMGLRDTRGAIVVGTPTAGLGAAVGKIHLRQNDVDAQISTEPVYALDGSPRSNLKPSIAVDLATSRGNDPILAAGLAAAKRSPRN